MHYNNTMFLQHNELECKRCSPTVMEHIDPYTLGVHAMSSVLPRASSGKDQLEQVAGAYVCVCLHVNYVENVDGYYCYDFLTSNT